VGVLPYPPLLQAGHRLLLLLLLLAWRLLPRSSRQSSASWLQHPWRHHPAGAAAARFDLKVNTLEEITHRFFVCNNRIL
jgi:hypothetical protein